MIRSGFAPRTKPMERGTSQLRRSAIARKAPKKARAPKIGGFPYVRSRLLLDLFKTLPCMVTGAAPLSDPAHSNWHVHGHFGAIKASDVFVAALSREVHRELDQGNKWTQAEKQCIWWGAHVKSVRALMAKGIWPASIPVPDIENYPFPIASPAAQIAGKEKAALAGGFVTRYSE
jgi:hypothetical protein